jgi:hypothetical protein
MKRIVVLADKHPWMVIWALVVFVLVIMAGTLTVMVQRTNASTAREARARAILVATSARKTCEAAVVAVTEQGKTDDLKILDVIKHRFEEAGRPVPPIYIALEAEVRTRQAPTASCIPKENP